MLAYVNEASLAHKRASRGKTQEQVSYKELSDAYAIYHPLQVR
jgi:hypothetical protein